MSNLLTQQEANKKRLVAATIGIVLVIVGVPFIFEWANSQASTRVFDLVAGGALLFAGGIFLGAAGMNRLGKHWWFNVTEAEEPLRPI